MNQYYFYNRAFPGRSVFSIKAKKNHVFMNIKMKKREQKIGALLLSVPRFEILFFLKGSMGILDVFRPLSSPQAVS